MKLSKFQTPEEVNSFFQKWNDLTELERLSLIKEFKEIGRLSISKEKEVKTTVSCPMHGFPIIKPCDLKKCHYYVQSSSSKNCLPYSVEKVKNNRLPSSTIATLMKISVSEVNQMTTCTVNRIKHTVVREKIEPLSPFKFKYLQGHCVNCGASLHDNLSFGHPTNLTIDEKYAWCDEECKKTKPKWQFQLEKDFGANYQIVLAAGVSVYKNPQTVDQLHGIPNGTTRSYMSQIEDAIDRM